MKLLYVLTFAKEQFMLRQWTAGKRRNVKGKYSYV